MTDERIKIVSAVPAQPGYYGVYWDPGVHEVFFERVVAWVVLEDGTMEAGLIHDDDGTIQQITEFLTSQWLDFLAPAPVPEVFTSPEGLWSQRQRDRARNGYIRAVVEDDANPEWWNAYIVGWNEKLRVDRNPASAREAIIDRFRQKCADEGYPDEYEVTLLPMS
jgi:hypothetical protein